MHVWMGVHKHHMCNVLSLHCNSLLKKLMNVQAIHVRMGALARIWSTNTIAHALMGMKERTVRQVCLFYNSFTISSIAGKINNNK